MGILAERMLASLPYAMSAGESTELQLDDTARALHTERRRIYDIVNVFEAVQIMSKVERLIQEFSCSNKDNLLMLFFKGWKERVPVARENLPGVQLGLASTAGDQAGRVGAVQRCQGAGDADDDPQPGERQHRERVPRLG